MTEIMDTPAAASRSHAAFAQLREQLSAEIVGQSGLIERQVALLEPDRLAALQGHGLAAIVEVSLDRQGAEQLDAFQARAIADDAVQQCWRVSPGPDFVLIVHTRDMPGYLALSQRLFTQDANVRNVKAFFATQRAKFETKLPIAHTQ